MRPLLMDFEYEFRFDLLGEDSNQNPGRKKRVLEPVESFPISAPTSKEKDTGDDPSRSKLF
jgi:hypothetical protein